MLLAVKSDIISQELTITSPCKIVAVKIELFKANPVIVCSVYRPPSSNGEYNEQLCKSLNKIALENPKSTIWITGDTNYPDINWETNSVHTHQYSTKMNEDFLSRFNDCGSEQIVKW